VPTSVQMGHEAPVPVRRHREGRMLDTVALDCENETVLLFNVYVYVFARPPPNPKARPRP